jgi:hypothetical protein
MSADWLRLLASHDFLGRLYDAAPPSVDLCRLGYVHIDERAHSVTLAFDTKSLPVRIPSDWEGRELNTLEFYLVFTDVERLEVTGWGAAVAKEVDLTLHEDRSLDVVLGTVESGMAFRASAVHLGRTRPYLASDSP